MSCAAFIRTRRAQSLESDSESGFVIVWFALMLTGLLAISALALDVGLWYMEALSVQKTADAAALGGAVYLPNNPATAVSTAKKVSTSNGYTDGDPVGNVVIQGAQVVGRPTDLQVKVTKTFNGIFGGLFGMPSLTITRQATAEYEQPIDMGSPKNIFGNEPLAPNDGTNLWGGTGFQPNMWGNVFGYQSPKQNGDAVQAGTCSFEDGCSSGTNTDYSNAGYFYKVTVDPSQAPGGAKLAIEVFDPAAVYAGDDCDQNGFDSSVASASNDFTTNGGTAPNDAAVRYAWGDTSNRGAGAGKFCSGDQQFGGANMPVTTYDVRADLNIADPVSNPVVNQGTCSTIQFPGYTTPLNSGVLSQGSGNYDAGMASVFRQWVPVCTFDPAMVPGGPPDYLLQIRTNVPLGGKGTDLGSPQSTGGANRFAIRAAWVTGGTDFTLGNYAPQPSLAGTGGAWSRGINIAGLGRMGLYANAAAGAAAPNFYMARVLPGGGNQTLEVRLFDIGDCKNCASAPILTFKDPNGNTWGNCQVRRGDTGSFANSSCSFPAQANGLWITVHIPIPAGYSCTTSNPLDCWTTMSYQLTSGSLLDTTTWAARILGNPVRLIK